MKNRNGKGSRRRPTDEKKVRANWDKIFSKEQPVELRPFEKDPRRILLELLNLS